MHPCNRQWDSPAKVQIASSSMQTEVKRNRSQPKFALSAGSLCPCSSISRKKSQVEEVVRRTVAEFGRIDVLLNCSALTYESDFLNFTEEAFNECIDRGPKAYFLTCQAVGRQMAGQRSGKIINLATTDARIASGESTGNSAAYSSIESMTRAIAQALGYYRVNVNSLVCGPMDNFSGTAAEAESACGAYSLGPTR